MGKVADLPSVRKQIDTLGGPHEITPHLRHLLDMDVPEGDAGFLSLVDQKIASMVPRLSATAAAIRQTRSEARHREELIGQGLDPRSETRLQGPADQSGAGPGSLYDTFHGEAQAEGWSRQGPATRLLLQGSAGAVSSTPFKVTVGAGHGFEFSTDPSNVPAPSSLGERVARGAGGGVTLAGEASALGGGPIAFGAATAAQQGLTRKERIVGGLTSAAAAWLSRFVPARVAAGVTGGFAGRVAAAETGAAAAGKAAEAEVASLMAAGLSEVEAQMVAARSLKAAVAATSRLSAAEAGQSGVARVAGAVTGAATSTVAFGAAEPYARSWALKALGEDVKPPTSQELAENLAAMGLLNAAAVAGEVGRALPRGGARPPAEPARLTGPTSPGPEPTGGPATPPEPAAPRSAPPAGPKPPAAPKPNVVPDAMPAVRGILKRFKGGAANPLDQGRTPQESIQQRATKYLPAGRPATQDEARAAFGRAASEVKALGWIHETIQAPPMPEGATASQQVQLQHESRKQSEALSAGLKGRDLDLELGETKLSVKVLEAFVYPWDADQVRVMGIDKATDTVVAFRMKDVDELKSVSSGISPVRAGTLRGEGGQKAVEPKGSVAAVEAPTPAAPEASVTPPLSEVYRPDDGGGVVPAPAASPRADEPAQPAFKRTMFRGTGRTADTPSPYGEFADGPIFGPGKYYAPDALTALHYGPEVMKADVEAKNPLVIRSDAEFKAFFGHDPNLITSAMFHPSTEKLEGEAKTPHVKALVAQGVKAMRAKIDASGHDAVSIEMHDDDRAKRLRETFEHDQVFIPEEESKPAPAEKKVAKPKKEISAPVAKVSGKDELGLTVQDYLRITHAAIDINTTRSALNRADDLVGRPYEKPRKGAVITDDERARVEIHNEFEKQYAERLTEENIPREILERILDGIEVPKERFGILPAFEEAVVKAFPDGLSGQAGPTRWELRVRTGVPEEEAMGRRDYSASLFVYRSGIPAAFVEAHPYEVYDLAGELHALEDERNPRPPEPPPVKAKRAPKPKPVATAPPVLEVPPADAAEAEEARLVAAAKPEPKRRLQQGDRVGVPSVWKRGPERRKGSVLGYVKHNDTEKVLVNVKKGKQDVPLEYSEHLVRKLPKIDRRALRQRKPELYESAREQMKGLSAYEMRELVNRLDAKVSDLSQQRDEALTDRRDPQLRAAADTRYGTAGKKLRAMRDELEAARSILYESEANNLEELRQKVVQHAPEAAKPLLERDVFEDRVEIVWQRSQLLEGMIAEARRAKAPVALLKPEEDRLRDLRRLLEPKSIALRLSAGERAWFDWAADVRKVLGEENPMDYGATDLSMFGAGPIMRLVAAKFFGGMGNAVRAYERGLGGRGTSVRSVDEHGNVVNSQKIEFKVDVDRQFVTYKLMRHGQIGAATAFTPRLSRAGYVMRAESAYLEGWAHDTLVEALGVDGMRWLGHAWSANSRKLFEVLDGKRPPTDIPAGMAGRVRELMDTMLTLAQKRAQSLGIKAPGRIKDYATHIRTGLAPETLDPLIEVLWPKTKVDPKELENARNRFFEHREGDTPYIQHFTPVFDVYVRTWARWMATSPFVKVAKSELYSLRDEPRRQKSVAAIIKAWVFPEKDALEKGMDSALRWAFYEKTSADIEQISVDEAAHHLGVTAAELKARTIQAGEGEAPLKEFVVVKKGSGVRFTTKTPWEKLGTTKRGNEIYGGHRGHAHSPQGPLQRPILERLNRTKATMAAAWRGKGKVRTDELLEELFARREEIRKFERNPGKMMMGRLAHRNLRAVLGLNFRAALNNLIGGAMTTYMEWGAVPFFRGVAAGGRAALQSAYRKYLAYARDKSHITPQEYRAAMEAMPLLLEEVLPEALGAVPGEIGEIRKRVQELDGMGGEGLEGVLDLSLRPFGLAESWNRGFDAANAIMVAKRMGLSHRSVRDHYEATEEGKRALMRDVLADMSDPSTISSFIVWQQAFTQFYYDMFGQGTYMSGLTGRLLGQLTTYPIAYGFHFVARPAEGAARTTYGFFRGLTGKGSGGDDGGQPPGTGPPPAGEEEEPAPRNWAERAAAKGGARWAHRHAFGIFVRQILLFGAMLTVSAWLAINAFTFGAPVIAALATGLLSWLFPQNQRLKSAWKDSRWGVVAVASSFVGISPTWILGGFGFLVTQADGFIELLRRQLTGTEVAIKRVLEEFPELFDRPGLVWTYDAMGQKSALYGMTLSQKVKHQFGLLPHDEAAKYRKKISSHRPEKKARVPKRESLLFQPA